MVYSTSLTNPRKVRFDSLLKSSCLLQSMLRFAAHGKCVSRMLFLSTTVVTRDAISYITDDQ